MSEIWKDIEGYEGCYQISNYGNFKSLKREYFTNGARRFTEEKILKDRLSTDGYLRASLSLNGKIKNTTIHRLVAKTFIPNLENKPEVNHIDGNKKNNNFNNLEWVNRSEQMIHAMKNNLNNIRKNVEGLPNPSNKLVIDYNTGIFYESAKQASIAKGIKYSTLKGMLTNRNSNRSGVFYI